MNHALQEARIACDALTSMDQTHDDCPLCAPHEGAFYDNSGQEAQNNDSFESLEARARASVKSFQALQKPPKLDGPQLYLEGEEEDYHALQNIILMKREDIRL